MTLRKIGGVQDYSSFSGIYDLSSNIDFNRTLFGIQNYSINSNGSKFWAAGEILESSFTFNTEGDRLYFVGTQLDLIQEFKLTEKFNPNTTVQYYEDKVKTFSNSENTFIFGNSGNKLYITNSTNIYQYSCQSPYDHVNITLDTTYTPATNLGTGIKFKPDGIKLYTSRLDQYIDTYTLSVAWDLSQSVTYESNSRFKHLYNISSFWINSSGTKLFVADQFTSIYGITSYNLSTPWDFSTATIPGIDFYDPQIAKEGSTTTANKVYGCTYGDNGNKIYVIRDSGEVTQYNLGTPYRVNNITSYTNKISEISGGPTSGFQSIKFQTSGADAGKKYWVINQVTDTLYEYVLTTAWDISTASYNNKFLNFTEKLISTTASIAFETIPSAFSFNNDGTLLYVLGTVNDPDNISRFTLSTPWDISTAIHEIEASRVTISADSSMQDVTFGDSGTKFYTIGTSGTTKQVYQYNLTTAWDITTSASGSTADKTFNINTGTSRDTDPRAVKFSSDGTTMFVLGNQNNIVIQYILSTAWDISTATYSKQFTIGTTQIALADIPTGLDFNSDGTKMFILGDEATNAVYQYTLSTAWDLGTVTLNNPTAGYTISTDSTPSGIVFGDNGTKMYVVGYTSDTIRQFNLSVAYDINSTITLQTSSISTLNDGGVTGIDFSSDGKIVYVCGDTTNRIIAFRLNTAWDISSHQRQRISLTSANSYRGLDVNNNDNYLYYFNTTNRQLYRLALTTAGSLVNGFTSTQQSLKNLAISFNDFSISNDGLYLLISTEYWLFTINISTAYDVSTIQTNYLEVSTLVDSLALHDNGSSMYISRFITSYDYLVKYNFGTNYDLNTISAESSTRLRKYNDIGTNVGFNNLYLSQDNSNLWALTDDIKLIKYDFTSTGPIYQGFFDVGTSITGAPSSIKFNPSGEKLYVLGSPRIYQIDLSSSFELKTAAYNTKSFAIARDGSPVSFVITPDENNLFVLGDTYDKIFQYKLSTPGEITSAYTYDYKLLSSQATDPRNFVFNLDGTIGYALIYDTIYQYDLTTAWDITTAVYSNKSFAVRFAIGASVGTLSDLMIMTDDGRSMAVLEKASGAKIFQFYLQTPWDISTAYFEKTRSINSAYSIFIGPPETISGVTAGTKMYAGGGTGTTYDSILEYNLSTPWDISTASLNYTTPSSMIAELDITGIFVNPEGTRLIYLSDSTNAFHSLELTTPWSLSSGRKFKVGYLSSADTSVVSVKFCKYGQDAGKILYALGDSNNRIYQYHLGTSYDILTLNNSVNTNVSGTPGYNASPLLTGLNVGTGSDALTGLDFNDDGTKVYVTDDSNNRILQFNLSTPWDIATLYGVPERALPSANANALSFQWGKDGNSGTLGKRLYVLDGTDKYIYQYDLGTEYTISTVNISTIESNGVPGYKIFNFSSSSETSPTSVGISNDGTKLYIMGSALDRIIEYILDTPWDVTTARPPYQVKLISSQTSSAAGLTFKSDGTKMYVMSSTTSDIVYQYSLSTAWDVSTANYESKSFTLQTEATHTGFDITDVYDAGGGEWKQHLYAVGTGNDRIYRYTITANTSSDAKFWDITQFGTVEATSLLVSGSDGLQHSIKVSRDGNNAGKYITLVGQTADDVFFYSMSTAYDLSTATLMTGTKDVSAEGTPTGVAVAYGSGVTEGTVFYVVGDTSDTIRQYSLKQNGELTPWASGTITWTLESSLLIGTNTTVNIAAATDLAVSKNGEWIYVLDANEVYGFPIQTAHELSTANRGDLYVGGNETGPTNFDFADNGSQLFLTGLTGDNIVKYSLSIPWLVSSASIVGETVTLTDGTPSGIIIKEDGSKYWLIGTTTDTLREYTPSVNYGLTLTTGPAISLFYITDPSDILFNNDGTKFFVLTTTKIYEFKVDSPYETNAIDFQYYTSVDTTPTAIVFKSDQTVGGVGNGTKFVVAGQTSDSLRTYTCQYPWNLSSVSSSVATGTMAELGLRGISFNVDGSAVYTVGNDDETIRQHVATDYADIPTSFTYQTYIGYDVPVPMGMDVSADGSKIFILSNAREIFEYKVDIPFNIGSIFINRVDQTADTTPYGLHIGNNGTKLTYLGDANDDIRVADLIYPWNVNNYTLTGFNTTIPDASPRGVWTSDDGKKIIMYGIANDRIYKYTTETGWDVNNYSNTGLYFNLSHRLDSFGLAFSSDGMNMYYVNGSTAVQVPLASAWDPETAYSAVVPLSTQDSDPVSMCKTSDGNNLYILGNSNNRINRYTLPVSNHITAMSYSQQLLHNTDLDATGLTCNESASTFWIIGPTNDSIYEVSNSGTNGALGTLSTVTSLNIANIESSSNGIHYESDINALYFTGYSSDSVYRIDLSSQESLINANTRELNVSSFSNTFKGFVRSFDGKKIYVCTSDVIFQLQLPPNNEISHAVYNNTFLYVGTSVGGPPSIKELVFSPNGYYLYFLDDTNDRIQSWKIKSLG